MTKLLSLAAMFALTSTLSFACDEHKDDSEACSKDAACVFKDGTCIAKPIDCSTRSVSDCAEKDKKCELKPAEGEKPAACVAVKEEVKKIEDSKKVVTR